MPQAEQIHKIFEEASKLAVEMARKELALLEFEMFNEVMISKESKEKAEKSLQKLTLLNLFSLVPFIEV